MGIPVQLQPPTTVAYTSKSLRVEEEDEKKGAGGVAHLLWLCQQAAATLARPKSSWVSSGPGCYNKTLIARRREKLGGD